MFGGVVTQIVAHYQKVAQLVPLLTKVVLTPGTNRQLSESVPVNQLLGAILHKG